MNKRDFKRDFLKKTYYNACYKTYKAAWVHETGLPEFSSYTFKDKDRRFLSRTSCKKLKMPVQEGELPVAWYTMKNGYTPLYFREWEDTEENREKLARRF